MASGKPPSKKNGSKRSPKAPVLAPECESALNDIAKDAPSKQGVFRKAYEGVSRKAAIDAKCLECVSYSTDAIRNCTAIACPLWAFRPYQQKRK